MFSTFTLPPGRYEVRVAARRNGEAGSVFLDVDVPDFARLSLSMSSLTLSHAGDNVTSAAETLAGLLPVMPTSAREFSYAGRVTAFVRLYQAANDAPAPVVARWRVVDIDDRTRADTTIPMAGTRFTSGRGADLSFDLPLPRSRPAVIS